MAEDIGERLARIEERLISVDKATAQIFKDMHTRFVTRDEFLPVKQVVYGMVGVLLLGVLATLGRLVLPS